MVLATHKTLGTLNLLLFEELKLESFMCISIFLVYATSTLCSVVVWARPEETMDLLNSWPYILSCIQEIRDEPPLSPFDDIMTTMKVMLGLAIGLGIAFAAGLLTIIMSYLPVCLFPLANSAGLIPEGILPHIGWQLLFLPLEYMRLTPPMIIAPYSASLLFVLAGVLKLYLQELR